MKASDYRASVIIAIISVLGIGAVISSGVISSLILFLLMGVVPGTSYTLSPETMLILWGVIAGIVLSGLGSSSVRYLREQPGKLRIHKKRPQLPRRRYARAAAQS